MGEQKTSCAWIEEELHPRHSEQYIALIHPSTHF